MNHGASDGETAELFERFVEDVAGIEIWSDENVGVSLQGAVWGFLGCYLWVDGGVELHFAVDDVIWVGLFDFIYDVVDFVEIRVLAAGAVSGVGKHGDFGLLASVFNEGCGGIFDDGVQLFGCGLFVDAAIGDGDDLVILFANKTAGEIGGFERKVSLVG